MENLDKEEKTRRPRRSKQQIKSTVLDAVSSLIKDVGFSNITLSSISQRSEVDANAILRSFGSLEDLLDIYTHLFDYWFRKTLENPGRLVSDPIGYYKDSIVNLADALYSNSELQALLIWELSEDNQITRNVGVNRELSNESVIKSLAEMSQKTGIDCEVISGILIAGIYFLILRRKRSAFFGVDFATRKGKSRLLETIKQLMDMYFNALEKRNEVCEIAKRMKSKGIDIDTIVECTRLEKDFIEELAPIQ